MTDERETVGAWSALAWSSLDALEAERDDVSAPSLLSAWCKHGTYLYAGQGCAACGWEARHGA